MVASLVPAACANYAVDGTATVSGEKGKYECYDRTPPAYDSWSNAREVPLATNGILFGGHSSVIEEVGKTLTNPGKVEAAALTGVQLSTANHSDKSLWLMPRNRISISRARGKRARPGRAVGSARKPAKAGRVERRDGRPYQPQTRSGHGRRLR